MPTRERRLPFPGFEDLVGGPPPETKIETRFNRITPSDIALTLKIINNSINPNDVLKGKHPEIYQPTLQQVEGAIRGVHGHQIHHEAVKLIRRILTYQNRDVAALRNIGNALEQHYDTWRAAAHYYYQHPRKNMPAHDGEISASQVMEIWNSEEVTNFARMVILAQQRHAEALVQSISRNNELPYNETNPDYNLAVEQQINGLNLILPDGAGIQTNLRPDYAINNGNDAATIIDLKYSPQNPHDLVTQATALLYKAAVAAMRQGYPNVRTFNLKNLRLADIRFYLKIFEPLGDYIYVEVPTDTCDIINNTLTPVAAFWQDHKLEMRRIKALKESGFYLPTSDDQNTFFLWCPAPPAIYCVAFTKFCMREATVMGPTPPGTGVIKPALFFTSL